MTTGACVCGVLTAPGGPTQSSKSKSGLGLMQVEVDCEPVTGRVCGGAQLWETSPVSKRDPRQIVWDSSQGPRLCGEPQSNQEATGGYRVRMATWMEKELLTVSACGEENWENRRGERLSSLRYLRVHCERFTCASVIAFKAINELDVKRTNGGG